MSTAQLCSSAAEERSRSVRPALCGHRSKEFAGERLAEGLRRVPKRRGAGHSHTPHVECGARRWTMAPRRLRLRQTVCSIALLDGNHITTRVGKLDEK